MTDPDALAEWYEAELLAVARSDGPNDYDAGYVIGMRQAARERGVIS